MRRSTKRSKSVKEQFGVALPDNLYIESFSYPSSTTKIDKAWEKSLGVRLAPCLKAIVGPMPYRWGASDSAGRIASEIFGRSVQLEYDDAWAPGPIVIESFRKEPEEDETSEIEGRKKTQKPTADEQCSLFVKDF